MITRDRQYVTAGGGGRHGAWRIDQGGADRSASATFRATSIAQSAVTQRTGGHQRLVMAAGRLARPGAMAAELADR